MVIPLFFYAVFICLISTMTTKLESNAFYQRHMKSLPSLKGFITRHSTGKDGIDAILKNENPNFIEVRTKIGKLDW